MRQTLMRAAVIVAVLATPALAQDLPPEADPIFVEAYNACLDGAAGGLPPEEAGWTSHDTGNVDAQAWDNYTASFATKDIEGVGGLNLSASVTKFPGYQLGTCTIRITEPQAEIDGPDIKHTPGFTGTLQGDGGDWSGAWRNDEATLFIRSVYSEARVFLLQVTTVTAGGGFP